MQPEYYVVSCTEPKLGAKGVIILHLQEPGAPHLLLKVMPAVQRLMLTADTPPLVIVDVSKLTEDHARQGAVSVPTLSRRGAHATAALDEEGRTRELTHELGEPTARALRQLLGDVFTFENVTLVGIGSVAQLVLKLLVTMAGEPLMSSVQRVVLLHPRIPAASVDTLLGHSGTRQNMPLDIIFQKFSERDRLLPAMRAIFPLGSQDLASGPRDALLATALITGESGGDGFVWRGLQLLDASGAPDIVARPLAPYDPMQCDASTLQ